ncbi:MAG: transcription elongation factor GreA [Alphaproteobacteria bacterium]|nr:transcription elongation factor GreA [Candidatus Parcubacteria bacterium]NCQ67566.1 transcription elongation factor GreA [Alphaproteobacteria bacterium]
MQKFPMTAKGHKALEVELQHLKNVERKEIIAAIAEARAHGDLSENAEYHAAREKQGFIEARIKDIEAKLGAAEVIDPLKMSGDIVRFSATVTIVDEASDEETTYQLVGTDESNIKEFKLSFQAPLSKALIGKSEGDSVSVQTPSGKKTYEILSVDYK